MMRACAVVALSLVAAAPVAAQEGAPPPTPAPAPETRMVMVLGTVFDTVSGRPLRLAVVRLAGTGTSTLTDDAGHYRLSVPAGDAVLEVRRIAYEPAAVTVQTRGGLTLQNLYLHPIAIGLAPVVVTAKDELGRWLMRHAIARKHEIFARLHDYRYDAYVKFVVRDDTKPPELPESVLLITETRTSAYWEQPDHYQETIVARRQSQNLAAEHNLVSVGEIVNFSRDRVDLQKYSVVSPIADDALNHYDYHVLDTLAVDGRRVFRLAIEPTSKTSPLFVGVIDVADSTYDVLSIDVGVNEAVRFNLLENLRYRQRLKDAGGGRWMPYEIRLTGEVRFGMPFPGLPERIAFEHVASLDHFQFDRGGRPGNLGEFRVVVHPHADRSDSAAWAAPGAVQLTSAERAAWAHIDSVERIPPPLGTRMLEGLGAAFKFSTNDDFFHFNRVDGATVGAGYAWRRIASAVLRAKVGYATGSDRWQYRFGARGRLSERQRLWVGASVYDESHDRPTLVSRDYNPTYRALLFRLDPHDYYRERGWSATVNAKVFNFTRLDVRYKDVRQSSQAVVTDYSVLAVDRAQRANPPILDGRMRMLSATFGYDSRPLLQEKGQAYYLQMLTRTHVTVDAELASPDLFPTDFDYRRYSVQIERRQKTLNLGLTSIAAVAGVATGHVPPQRYFIVDFGMSALTFQNGGFNTLGERNFGGTRAAMFAIRHDFDRLLFAKSGIPLVRDVPLTLSVHGAVFWTDFKNHVLPGDELLATARRPYSEVGFGLGNLTPFLSPLNVAMHFTWQLSSYDTSRWVAGLWFTPP
jgi:hypothetical protein